MVAWLNEYDKIEDTFFFIFNTVLVKNKITYSQDVYNNQCIILFIIKTIQEYQK